MAFSLRTILAIVFGFAIAFGAIAATVTLPSSFSNVPEGVLLILSLFLLAVGVANVFAGDRPQKLFWLCFVTILVISSVMSVFDTLAQCNTLPEHVARFFAIRGPGKVNLW